MTDSRAAVDARLRVAAAQRVVDSPAAGRPEDKANSRIVEGGLHMQVKDIMTEDPTCCTAQDPLQKAAQLMVDCDCGEIPVVDDVSTRVPIGVITDRDITCRTVAKGLNPLEMTVGDAMTSPIVSVRPYDSLENCCNLMEQNQIRRVPVVDDAGTGGGIISLADIALKGPKSESHEVLQEVSEMSASASSVG